MKFTIGWLREHLDFDASLEALTDKLTALGLEVEEVIDPASALAPFRIAEVIEASPHPDADRLQVCRVNTGSGEVQVVCGAPNARTGLKGVFAPSGTHIPGTGMDLRPTKIRGVESSGMLCSERELMLSEEHEGIIDLDADAPVGELYATYAGLDDPVIDIAITPNRQDCLGVAGIARDLAAGGMGTLTTKTPEPVSGAGNGDVGVKLDFGSETKDACPMFAGQLIRGVKNGQSPAWLQARLRAIGLRPISALVDITNFITHDQGRPLHVYDVAKLKGDIRARIATKGESFLALDGNEYECDGSECVITDDRGVIGFGGVIGGDSTGCDEGTTDVFIECALFDPVRTAMTGRRHGIESDARYRFERGVDPEFVLPGLAQAAAMVMDLCGGTACEPVVAGEAPDHAKTIDFRPERVFSLGGVEIDESEALAILERLGFSVGKKTGESIAIGVPSWRVDVVGEADLVEEVTRIYGYEHIETAALPRKGVARATLTIGQRRARAARRRLAAEGFVECITWSFMNSERVALFGGGKPELGLDNPISSELDAMRPSILPNLIEASGRNQDRGEKSIRLFEIGPQYENDGIDGQSQVAAGIMAGSTGPRHWAAESRAPDAFDAKAAALAALQAAGAPVDKLQTSRGAPNWYHPGRSGLLTLGPKVVLAAFGEVHPATLKSLDAKGAVVGFEVFLDAIPAPRAKKAKSRGAMQTTDLQRVERDFAFVLPKDADAQSLLRAVRGADKAAIKRVDVFDVFEGGSLDAGEKSLAISVLLEPAETTFTDVELEAISAKVVAAAEKSVGARLRS